ncbi:MAG: T9SS type A sorting domain-containing protein [Prolixibacteraceae bacterium]|nr:T9SS type A sorting domain-containing protein [Prolixibacteraceae bacterium]
MKKLFFLAVVMLIFEAAMPQLIIDHNHTDITVLKESQINLAKSTLHIAYGHTSHGSQVTDGMSGLVGFANGGGKELSLPNNIFAWNNGGTGGALDLHDYAMGGDVGYYPQWYNNTVNYLNNPDNSDVNVIMWSWCGQASGYSEQNMIDYFLNPMTLLETNYPNVKFVYMTGHLDGTGLTGNLHLRNEQIRDYCNANNKILYDFADIESYDPDQLTNYMLLNATDECWYDSDDNGSRDANWATDWQSSHTQNVDWYYCTCQHSQPLNGNQKAYAAWHLFVGIANLINLENVPTTRTVSNTNVADGESDCFDASETLSVAGDETDVEIESGGFAEFISGGIIRFLPGFHAHNGSNMQAYITTDNNFCNVIPLESEQSPVFKSERYEASIFDQGLFIDDPFSVNLYPNPNKGIFRILTNSETGNMNIKVFDNAGTMVFKRDNILQAEYVNLQKLRPGIYFLQAFSEGKLKTSKFIIE